MTDPSLQWAAVDDWFSDRLVPVDPVLDAALDANTRAGLPAHDVSPSQGRLLQLLALVRGARRILEIGTLGGYSTICLARTLPAGGTVVTIEADPAHAEVARSNVARAGLADLVDIRVGAALDVLPQLVAEDRGPFDLVFIDADKPNNPQYLTWALRLAAPGTVLVADNVVRNGAVIDADSDDPSVQGVRRFTEQLAAEPRLSATAIQTVGTKGYDGFILALVTS
ncbi:MAG TPA: O-methyltransferase [Acidimicrobiales bacterium]